MLKYVHANIWKMAEEGFAMPPVRKLQEALTRGMEPLQEVLVKEGLQRKVKLCSYTHILNLCWGRIIDHIEAILEFLERQRHAHLSEGAIQRPMSMALLWVQEADALKSVLGDQN